MTNDEDRATRVEAALAGDLELRELSVKEAAVFNAEVAAAIQKDLMDKNYGSILAQRGVTIVALDDNGDILEHRPDGSSTVVAAKRRRSSTAKPK